MTFEKLFGFLVSIVGRVLAQIICIAITWSIIGGMFRLYTWLNGEVSGGLDPVKFGLSIMISIGLVSIWRFFAENDLDG